MSYAPLCGPPAVIITSWLTLHKVIILGTLLMVKPLPPRQCVQKLGAQGESGQMSCATSYGLVRNQPVSSVAPPTKPPDLEPQVHREQRVRALGKGKGKGKGQVKQWNMISCKIQWSRQCRQRRKSSRKFLKKIKLTYPPPNPPKRCH